MFCYGFITNTNRCFFNTRPPICVLLRLYYQHKPVYFNTTHQYVFCYGFSSLSAYLEIRLILEISCHRNSHCAVWSNFTPIFRNSPCDPKIRVKCDFYDTKPYCTLTVTQRRGREGRAGGHRAELQKWRFLLEYIGSLIGPGLLP